MMLEVAARLRRGGFVLDAEFTAEGRSTALFGQSGSGKSTLAAIVAGLVSPEDGSVRLDGDTLFDRRRGIDVPVHKRRVGIVFQDGCLFPHLTVRQNLLFGAGIGKSAQAAFDAVVALLGIGHCLARRPGSLSGGEQRRVAIGRALLAAPRLLILDEPMAGLDAARKAEIMPYLERLCREGMLPILLISHAMDEVVRLADDLVLLDDGRVTAYGPLSQVLHRVPAGAAYADAGAVIETVVAAIDAENHLARLVFADGAALVPDRGLTPGERVRLHIRARDVALAVIEPVGLSILNVLPATIAALEPGIDGTVDVSLKVGSTLLAARITALSATALGLAPGRPVFALIKSLAFDRSPRTLTISGGLKPTKSRG